MAATAKRMQNICKKIDGQKEYAIDEALALLKEVSDVKFDESCDVSVHLGVDPRKSDQIVRGAAQLPKGSGRKERVAVFAQGAAAESAKEAGADRVGFEDLADDIKQGKIEFEILIATPDAMRTVGQLGTILGPKGLMPNPKLGTVTPDVAAAVVRAKLGQARYRTEKAGIVHCSIGRLSFTVADLKENLLALLADLKKAKPASAKGSYLKQLVVSSTMGPGLKVELSTVNG
jgi:large subunit ribosomal protein L1